MLYAAALDLISPTFVETEAKSVRLPAIYVICSRHFVRNVMEIQCALFIFNSNVIIHRKTLQPRVPYRTYFRIPKCSPLHASHIRIGSLKFLESSSKPGRILANRALCMCSVKLLVTALIIMAFLNCFRSFVEQNSITQMSLRVHMREYALLKRPYSTLESTCVRATNEVV